MLVQDVLVVKVPDRPSGLAEVLEVIEKEDISVEYLYSFVENERGSARLIFRLSDAERAEAVLKMKGVEIIGVPQADET